jgi:valyl-tRNA synthetase
VVVAPWPVADSTRVDAAADAEIAALQRLITEVRRFRSEQRVNPGQRVPARISGLGELAAHEEAMRTLLRLTPASSEFAPTARLALGETVVELDLSGSIDVGAERRRLEKDLAVAETERSRALGKLGNEAFLGKAPDAVVAKVRGQLAAAEADVERIEAALAALPTEASQ